MCLALLLLLLFAPRGLALEVPRRPEGYVTDRAGLLSPRVKSQLEAYLYDYERETTNQVVIATFPSLDGEALEDFSIRFAEAWKVGQKGRDNGVIFLVFKEDREMRIEVGYGLEGVLPDALAGEIVHGVVAPRFRQGDYEGGIIAGVQAIVQATRGEYRATESGADGPYERAAPAKELSPEEMAALRRQGEYITWALLILVLILFIVDYERYRRYRYDHRIYRDRYTFWEWWFRFAILSFILNMLFRVMFYGMLYSRGGYYGGRGGFRGFSGGGGSFGGGGASGRW